MAPSPNKRKFLGNEHFEIVNGVNGYGKWSIEGCDYCTCAHSKNSPVHSKPLQDHLRRKHSELYEKCEQEFAKKKKYQTTLSSMLLALL